MDEGREREGRREREERGRGRKREREKKREREHCKRLPLGYSNLEQVRFPFDMKT